MPNHQHTKSISTTQGPVYVKSCGCGGIHLCIGGVSINLAKETALFLQSELENLFPKTKPNYVVLAVNNSIQN